MNKLSKWMSGIVAGSVLMTMTAFVSPVLAADDINVVVGEKLVFAQGSEPIIADNRTMLPLRAVSEALNATVYWFNDDKRVQIVLYDTLLSLQIGNNIMGKYSIENGEPVSKDNIEMDVAAMIYNDRTYVPLRAIAEAFSADVKWDNINRTAVIAPASKAENFASVAQLSTLPVGTLVGVYGVITRDNTSGMFYLRSLQKNTSGSYDQIPFCTPVVTSLSENTEYGEYISQYWLEQFGSENPSGTVVYFTGITSLIEGTSYVVLNKTTTGIRSLGNYDVYMTSLGMNFEPFTSVQAY